MHHLAANSSNRVLDVACGTGNYTAVLQQSGLDMTGLDISDAMLTEAYSKYPDLPLSLGNVLNLPFKNDSFQSAICTLATHHFPKLLPAFQEVFRVLSFGRLVIFTATPEQMRGYWLNEYFPIAMEDSIVQMPSYPETEQALKEAGFSNISTEAYEMKEDLQDLFLYSGKHKPAVYLDEEFRSGISTFASLADPLEVTSGCEKLIADINSGRISEIISKYVHDIGDYLYIIAEKNVGAGAS
jgi:SAM-dependent methyltransferase